MPCSQGRQGRPFAEHRTVVEGIIYRYRVGIPWRYLPECFGPWQTVWKRHRRFSGDGTWDQILAVLLTHADAADLIDREVSIDSTVNRAHRHATNLPRDTVTYDTEAYKRRNVVERSFNIFKQWRVLATRYDRLALTYRGGIVLRATTTWLKALGDTP